jgi:hypothetical protein
MTANEGAFLIVVMFLFFCSVLIVGSFVMWLVSFFMNDSTDFPVDSGLRKSDVGRANSVWGDKD